MKCQEETEQDQEVRELEQAEEWVKALSVEVKAGVVGGEEVVLRQARAVIVFVPIAVREQPINWGPPVTTSNALSAERLWPGNRT
mgnify:CR=1 FL=1